MNKKRIGFIPIHGLLMLIAILYFYPDARNPETFISDVCFSLLLVLIGSVIYLRTEAVQSSLLFLILMYVSAWIMILLNDSSHFYVGLGRALMSVAPNLLFVFFVSFTDLPKKAAYRNWNLWLFFSSLLTLAALISFHTSLSYVFFFHLFFSILACVRLSVQYASKQRRILSKERRLLNGAIAFSFMPFITGYMLFGKVISSQIRYSSIYLMLALPLAVGYVLIKRSGSQTRYNYKMLMKLIFAASSGASVFVCFSCFYFGLSLLESLVLLLIACSTFYLYAVWQRKLSKRQLEAISQTKETLEKERLDILQKITYDHYLTALGGLIKQLIHKTLPLNGSMIVWKDNAHSYILEQSGIFEEFSFKQMGNPYFQHHIDHMQIGGESYFVFPLIYKQTVNGWMIVGHKDRQEKFTLQEIDMLSMLADTVCEILKTTEILQENQRRYVYLPRLQYEDYESARLSQNTEKIRKEVALYLHDEILQSILAVRHMNQALATDDSEIQRMILETLDELNLSIRNKMFDIYPTTLQDLGMYQSLSVLCRKLKEEALHQPHLKIRLEAEIELEVEERLRYTVFRAIKELLQNAVKHAAANEIVVSVELSVDHLLVVDVIDDGKGFDIEHDLRSSSVVQHIGLLSVKQDVNAMGGELNIRKNLSSGMHIQFKIPIGRIEEAHVHHTG